MVKVEVWLFSGEVWVWPIWYSNNSNTTASAACFCTAADCHKIVLNLIFTAHKWPQFTSSISTSNTTSVSQIVKGLSFKVGEKTVWVCYGLNSMHWYTQKLADKLADTLVKTKFDPANRTDCAEPSKLKNKCNSKWCSMFYLICYNVKTLATSPHVKIFSYHVSTE